MPLGNRRAIGVILGASQETPTVELKSIDQVIDPQSVMPSDWLAVIQWAAGYYGCRLETMLRTAMPAWGKHGRPIETPVTAYQWQGEPPKGPKKQQIYHATQQPMASAAVKAISPAVVRELIKTGQLVPAQLPLMTGEDGPA